MPLSSNKSLRNRSKKSRKDFPGFFRWFLLVHVCKTWPGPPIVAPAGTWIIWFTAIRRATTHCSVTRKESKAHKQEHSRSVFKFGKVFWSVIFWVSYLQLIQLGLLAYPDHTESSLSNQNPPFNVPFRGFGTDQSALNQASAHKKLTTKTTRGSRISLLGSHWPVAHRQCRPKSLESLCGASGQKQDLRLNGRTHLKVWLAVIRRQLLQIARGLHQWISVFMVFQKNFTFGGVGLLCWPKLPFKSLNPGSEVPVSRFQWHQSPDSRC